MKKLRELIRVYRESARRSRIKKYWLERDKERYQFYTEAQVHKLQQNDRKNGSRPTWA